MFKIPRVNVIESDEGFSVEVLGQRGLRYTEGGKSLRVNSEMLASDWDTAMVVYKSSIHHWDPPHSHEVIDPDKIINNIRRAFRFKGHEIEVD
jgi:hypothetical protein